MGQLAENDVIRQVLRLVVRTGFMVFPYREGGQFVNEDKLCELYDEIRVAAISLPAIPGSTDYGRIVQERPPVGSQFTRRGGYTTPEGIVICRTLRNKVKALQDEFVEEARLQRARAGLARSQGMPTFVQPLIEDEYMDTESAQGFYRPPTPSPSPHDTRSTWRSHQSHPPNPESPYRAARRARDAGN
jgi:hypothetical protein